MSFNARSFISSSIIVIVFFSIFLFLLLQVFTGNSDSNTIVSHALKAKFTTRYVRFVVQTWYEHISMRVELYGCAES